MNVSEETLMAYVDGELDAPTRAAVDAAIAASPELAARVVSLRALNQKLQVGFDSVLKEEVPERLLAAVRARPRAEATSAKPATAKVVELASVRSSANPVKTPQRRAVPAWAAIAASLLVGVLVGRLALPQTTASFTNEDGRMLARGELARALTEQLASTTTSATAVKVGLSFLAKSGDYCRSFTLTREQLAGLACRDAKQQWYLPLLAQAPATVATGDSYRTASSEVPRAVLRAVDDTIVGEPLDAAAEAAVQKNGWRK